jgi:hypothetical protein
MVRNEDAHAREISCRNYPTYRESTPMSTIRS